MRKIILYSLIFYTLLNLNVSLFAQIKFKVPDTYLTGNSPVNLSIGDLNGDFKPDLVVVNSKSNTVSVFFNNGSGQFGTSIDYQIGNNPYWVILNDFNNDNYLDIATSNFDSNSISILTNTGQGLFPSRRDYPVGTNPRCIYADDLNGDNKLDIVTANYESDFISILFNSDTGLQVAKSVNIGSSSIGHHAVAIKDFNEDGKKDIVVTNRGEATLSILTNSGNGALSHYQTITIGGSGYSIVASDFNRDNKIDIASTILSEGKLSVVTNVGLNITNFRNYNTGSYPINLTTTDLTGNGYPDFIVANSNENTISILTNSGTGVLGNKINITVGANPTDIVTGDLNGDDVIDIATSNSGSNTISVLFGIKEPLSNTLISYVNVEIFPNPNMGVLYIENNNYQYLPFEISNTVGVNVLKGELRLGLNELNLNLSPGIYLLKIFNLEKKIIIK